MLLYNKTMGTRKYILTAIVLIGIAAILYVSVPNKNLAPVGDLTVMSVPAASTTVESKSSSTVAKKQVSSKVSNGVVIKNGMYIVSYENSGFQPKTLDIKPRSSVRFVNDSSKALRVASTDTTVSQTLSQPKTVGKGGYYDYTFNDIGVYPFANMNNTADRGVVTVH